MCGIEQGMACDHRWWTDSLGPGCGRCAQRLVAGWGLNNTWHHVLPCTDFTSFLEAGRGPELATMAPRGDDQGDKDRKRKSSFCTELLYSRSLSHVSDSLAAFVFLLSRSGESDIGIRFRLRIRKQKQQQQLVLTPWAGISTPFDERRRLSTETMEEGLSSS